VCRRSDWIKRSFLIGMDARGELRLSSRMRRRRAARAARLREVLTSPLVQRTDMLSDRMLRLVQELAEDWRRLENRIDAVTTEIETLARQDEGCRPLMSVPGIGAMTASAAVATIGMVEQPGRDVASEPGWGWCLSHCPTGTEPCSAGSATALTNICARSSSSGLLPCWPSLKAGRNATCNDGWRRQPSVCITTFWLHLQTNSLASRGACCTTAIFCKRRRVRAKWAATLRDRLSAMDRPLPS